MTFGRFLILQMLTRFRIPNNQYLKDRAKATILGMTYPKINYDLLLATYLQFPILFRKVDGKRNSLNFIINNDTHLKIRISTRLINNLSKSLYQFCLKMHIKRPPCSPPQGIGGTTGGLNICSFTKKGYYLSLIKLL